jgi:hypothetical protein
MNHINRIGRRTLIAMGIIPLVALVVWLCR